MCVCVCWLRNERNETVVKINIVFQSRKDGRFSRLFTRDQHTKEYFRFKECIIKDKTKFSNYALTPAYFTQLSRRDITRNWSFKWKYKNLKWIKVRDGWVKAMVCKGRFACIGQSLKGGVLMQNLELKARPWKWRLESRSKIKWIEKKESKFVLQLSG